MFLVDRSISLVVTGCDDTEDPDLEMDCVSCKIQAFVIYIYMYKDIYLLSSCKIQAFLVYLYLHIYDIYIYTYIYISDQG